MLKLNLFSKGKNMPDITMCNGTGCPRKDSCYRHTAVPSEYRQSFFMNPPLKEDGSCEYYWVREGQKVNREKQLPIDKPSKT